MTIQYSKKVERVRAALLLQSVIAIVLMVGVSIALCWSLLSKNFGWGHSVEDDFWFLVLGLIMLLPCLTASLVFFKRCDEVVQRKLEQVRAESHGAQSLG